MCMYVTRFVKSVKLPDAPFSNASKKEKNKEKKMLATKNKSNKLCFIVYTNIIRIGGH